jgi:hypothetical protein
MDAQLKAKWVEALRSEQYLQTQGMLRFRDDEGKSSFCCLGVLCDVAGVQWRANVPFLNGVRMEEEDECYLTRQGLAIVTLPDSVQRELANMNDTGKSFAEIADYIEQNL